MSDAMEDEEFFCLKWDDHHSNMMSNFGNLFKNQTLSDVTIACDGISIKAHKLVLSASSPFFHKLLLDNPSTNPILILCDVKPVDLQSLIHFMYHGQVNISENQLPAILKAAENLKIIGLGDCMRKLFNLDKNSSLKSILNENADSETGKNVNQAKLRSDRIHTDHSYVEEIIPYDQNSESNSLNDDKMNDSTVDDNLDDMDNAFESNSDINPLKLMEQSMTTEDVVPKKNFSENPSGCNSYVYNTENADYDSIHITLPENAHLSELESSTINQSYKTLNLPEGIVSNRPLSGGVVTATVMIPVDSSKTSCSSSAEQSAEYTYEGYGFGKVPQSLTSDNLSQSPGLSLATLESLSESSKRGRKPGSRLCIICKHVFHSEIELQTHMDNHKSAGEDADSPKFPDILEFNDSQPVTEKNLLKLPLACSTCKYVMSSLSDAQSHLSSNPTCRTSQFKCVLCPKIFIWPATLMKHFREQHEGPGGITRVTRRMWFYCDVCQKPLLSKHALSLHRSKFHGLMQPIIHGTEENVDNCKRGRKRGTRVCGICKRTFLGSDYYTHVQTVHKHISLSDNSVEALTYMNESISNESNSSQSAA